MEEKVWGRRFIMMRSKRLEENKPESSRKQEDRKEKTKKCLKGKVVA
jgi:hypothetical protein